VLRKRSTLLLGHVLHGLVDMRAGNLHILQVQPTPGDAAIPDPENRDPAHVEPGSIDPASLPVPLGPPNLTLTR
jgi:hypothetical protein